MLLDPDDYLYVTGADIDADHPHGDMDRVLFDGGVMPTRGGYTGRVDRNGDPISRKNILRGEDVCFLAEALTERGEFCDYSNHASGFRFDPWTPSKASDSDTSDLGPYPFRTFTRRLSAHNHYTLLHACNAVGTTNQHGPVWLPVEDSSLPDSPRPVYIGTTYGDAEIATYLQGFGSQWAPAGDPSWRVPPTPEYGARLQLSRAPMDAMFESLKLMHTAGYGPIFHEHDGAAPAHYRISSWQWQNGAWGPYSDGGAYPFLGSPVWSYHIESNRAPQESDDTGWKNPFHVQYGTRGNINSVDSDAVLATNVPRGASAYRLYFLWYGSARASRSWWGGPDPGKTERPIDTGDRYYMSSLPGWQNVPANRVITLPDTSGVLLASVLPGIRSDLGLTDDFYSSNGVPPFVLGNAVTVDSWEYFRVVSASIVCMGVVILLAVDGRTKW